MLQARILVLEQMLHLVLQARLAVLVLVLPLVLKARLADLHPVLYLVLKDRLAILVPVLHLLLKARLAVLKQVQPQCQGGPHLPLKTPMVRKNLREAWLTILDQNLQILPKKTWNPNLSKQNHMPIQARKSDLNWNARD